MWKFIKNNFKYLKYILKHKWYVFIACCKLGIPIRGLFHDMSKFKPSEWFPYLNYFYTADLDIDSFNLAWLKHIHRNSHHWQYWILREDSGNLVLLEMPRKYIKEMVADWIGAGKAITGKDNTPTWYAENKDKMLLNGKTKIDLETYLHKLYGMGKQNE